MHYYCHANSQQKGFHGVTTDSQKKGLLPWCCWMGPSHGVVERVPPMVLLKGSLPWCCWKDRSHGVVERVPPMVLLKGSLPWCCWKGRFHGVVPHIQREGACCWATRLGWSSESLCVAISRLPSVQPWRHWVNEYDYNTRTATQCARRRSQRKILASTVALAT